MKILNGRSLTGLTRNLDLFHPSKSAHQLIQNTQAGMLIWGPRDAPGSACQSRRRWSGCSRCCERDGRSEPFCATRESKDAESVQRSVPFADSLVEAELGALEGGVRAVVVDALAAENTHQICKFQYERSSHGMTRRSLMRVTVLGNASDVFRVARVPDVDDVRATGAGAGADRVEKAGVLVDRQIVRVACGRKC